MNQKQSAVAAMVDMKLEVVIIPVSDVDRAKVPAACDRRYRREEAHMNAPTPATLPRRRGGHQRSSWIDHDVAGRPRAAHEDVARGGFIERRRIAGSKEVECCREAA